MNQSEMELVESLRSGAYVQTMHFLRADDGFCCLGVACDISHLSSWFQKDKFTAFHYDDEAKVLPTSVKEWLNWSDHNGTLNFLTRGGAPVHLADLNDHGFSFSQIADIIQAGLVLHYGEKVPE